MPSLDGERAFTAYWRAMAIARGRTAALIGAACVLAVTLLHCSASRFDGLTGGGKKGDEGGAPPPTTGSEASVPPPAGGCSVPCEEQHPGAVQLDGVLFQCWEINCPITCVDRLPGGDAGELDAAGAPACPGYVPPTTPSDCAECSRLRCCTPWNNCFNSAECAALDQCFRRCEGN